MRSREEIYNELKLQMMPKTDITEEEFEEVLRLWRYRKNKELQIKDLEL